MLKTGAQNNEFRIDYSKSRKENIKSLLNMVKRHTHNVLCMIEKHCNIDDLDRKKNESKK